MTPSFAIGWRQVAVCFLLLAATGMVAPTYSIVAVPLDREFHPDRATLMLTMTVYSGVSALLSPLLGALMDRVPLRRMFIIGGLALGGGYAAMSLASTFNHILVVFGLLIAPANILMGPVAATVLLSRWFAFKRGRAMGIAIAGISAGGFLFPFIIQGLLEAFPWRTALPLLGVVLAIWTIVPAFLVVDRPGDRGLYPDGASEPPPLAAAELAKPKISAWRIVSDPAFWMIVFTVSIVTAGMKGMITNVVPLAVGQGIAAAQAALLVSLYAGCSLLAKLSFAGLADRLGPRPMMFLALAGFALGMGCLTQAEAGYGVIALGVSLVGLLGGFMMPVESFIAPRIFGQRAVGKAMGLLSGAILIAMLLSPWAFGKVFDVTGSYSAVFWTFSGLAVLALLWVPLIRLTAREEKEPGAAVVPAE